MWKGNWIKWRTLRTCSLEANKKRSWNEGEISNYNESKVLKLKLVYSKNELLKKAKKEIEEKRRILYLRIS